MKTTLEAEPKSIESALEEERRAFANQRVRLMREYPGQYVGLHGSRAVDHDTNDEALAERMFEKFGDAPFYIARLEDTPTVYEFTSPESQK